MKAWLGWLVALSLLPACRPATVRVPRFTAKGNLTITVDAYARLSKETGAVAVQTTAAAEVPQKMVEINQQAIAPKDAVDLVYVVDTTGSMGDDIQAAKTQMKAILADLTARNPDRRVGLVAYRDRDDIYTAMVVLPLDTDVQRIQEAIDSLTVDGGGDLPEHVYAGLDTALHQQPWRRGASHHIVLIGDAPPHEDYTDDPRNHDSVTADAARPELKVKIHTIGANCDKDCQAALAEATP
jgi:Mg-chelatase subunit ChlD